MTYRNRAHLDLARQAPRCFGCGAFNRGDVVAAHANHVDKGMGLKAPDWAWAALGSLCGCHPRLDQGSDMTREERRDFWFRAFVETQNWLWNAGLLVVATDPVEHVNAPKPPSRKMPKGRKLPTGRALPKGRKLQGRPFPTKPKS